MPRLAEATETYGSLLMTEFTPSWPTVRTLLGEGGHRYIEMSMDKANPVGLEEYLRLTGVLLGLRRSWAEFLDAYPLLLAPVFTEPPPAPGVESRDAAGHDRVGTAMRLCSATSLTGVPAVAVPAAVADGLPIGVQLIGRAYREDLCLDAAEAVERQVGPLTPIDPVDAVNAVNAVAPARGA